MGEICFDSRKLESAIARDKEGIADPFMAMVDGVTRVEPGSFLGRQLSDYLEILGHNVNPNFLEIAKGLSPALTIVDAGCGAGLVLAGLRQELPDARLVGIDERNVALNKTVDKATGRTVDVGEILDLARVEFTHDTFLNLGAIVPEGYDILLSVGAFYGAIGGKPTDSVTEALKVFYDGLRTGGSAFIQFNPLEQTLDKVASCLGSASVPFEFHEADRRVLSRHALSTGSGLLGTLVLGPKP